MKFTSLHYWTVILITGLLISCSSLSRKAPAFANETPGGIPINDTLFCDVTEVTNFHWLEYLYWLSRQYGDDSQEYKNALPKDEIWSEFECLSSYEDQYWRHPAYRDFPLVGITQQQAENYSKWRSDRVFEYYLIKNRYMEFTSLDSTKIRGNPFTIERYFNGTYTPNYVKTDPKKVFIRDTSLHFPTYRLPSKMDRAIILDYVDSTDFRFATDYPRKEQKWMSEQSIIVYLEIEPCDSATFLMEPFTYVSHGYPAIRNLKFLHNIRGNVAEWSSESDLTFGGGWPHTRSYVYKHDTISCDYPNAWTGFRNVCSWSKFKYED